MYYPGIRITDLTATLRLIVVLLALFFISLSSQANSPVASHLNLQQVDKLKLRSLAPEHPGHFPVGGYSAFLEDESGDMQLADVLTATTWQTSQSENPNFGFSSSTFWLIAKVDTSKVPSRWFVRNHYSLIDHFDVYTCTSLQQPKDCLEQLSGDLLPFSQRMVNHPELIIPLPAMNEPYWLLFRMATEGTHQFPTDLVDEKSLYDDLLFNSWLRGGYISMIDRKSTRLNSSH